MCSVFDARLSPLHNRSTRREMRSSRAMPSPRRCLKWSIGLTPRMLLLSLLLAVLTIRAMVMVPSKLFRTCAKLGCLCACMCPCACASAVDTRQCRSCVEEGAFAFRPGTVNASDAPAIVSIWVKLITTNPRPGGERESGDRGGRCRRGGVE
jgi:hypothetical protein